MPGFSTRSNLPVGAVSSKASGAARFPLSESPSGTPIALTNAGTLIHSAATHAMDEVYLWVSNYNASDTTMTMSFDSTTTGDSDSIIISVQGQNGLSLVYPGIPHLGTSIYIKANSDDRLNVVGYVVRRFREDPSNALAGYDGGS